MRQHLKTAVGQKLKEKVGDRKWQGRLLWTIWEDNHLSKRGYFAWLNGWSYAPTHAVAGAMELYEQLLPTRGYSAYKTVMSDQTNILCRMCGKVPESLAHVLAGCSSLAQIKYMDRRIAALKVLFFDMLRDLKLADSVPPWYSRVEPQLMYESTDTQAFWDVPVYAEHTFVRANKVDALFVDHKAKRVLTVEESCPWLNNRTRKDTEKIEKYEPLRWEFARQYPGYKIVQLNVIMDVLGG